MDWTMSLYVMAAGCILAAWEAAAGALTHGPLWKCKNCMPPVADPGPCVPPLDPSAHVGLRGYGSFFANDSLIGRRVHCTRDDKICFRHNLIFDPGQDRCEPIGGGHFDRCDLSPNMTEFLHGSGRIIGICKEYEDPCPGYRMSYNGRCYRKEIVRDVICGCEAKLERHFMEGVVCRSLPAAKRINVRQPLERTRCVIPDLRFPDSERVRFFKNPLEEIQGFKTDQTGVLDAKEVRLSCSPKQAKCFSEGKVSVSGFRGCFDLLERGPCPKFYLIALDAEAAMQGRAETTCVHVRGGCPRGHSRMLFDGECHENREIIIEAPGDIKRNQYGALFLIPYRFNRNFNPTLNDGLCQIKASFVGGVYSMGLPQPPCGRKDNGRCELYEVENEPPNPLDDLDSSHLPKHQMIPMATFD